MAFGADVIRAQDETGYSAARRRSSTCKTHLRLVVQPKSVERGRGQIHVLRQDSAPEGNPAPKCYARMNLVRRIGVADQEWGIARRRHADARVVRRRVENSRPRTQHRMAGQLIRRAQPRRKIRRIGSHQAPRSHTRGYARGERRRDPGRNLVIGKDQGIRSGNEIGLLIFALDARRPEFPPHTVVHGEAVGDFPIVLRERGGIVLADIADVFSRNCR